jgi:hypothetical protein
VVNAFDVLLHITDDARWERAVSNLAAAVAPGGLLLVTDTFAALPGLAAHNKSRPLALYRERLAANGLVPGPVYPTARAPEPRPGRMALHEPRASMCCCSPTACCSRSAPGAAIRS